MGMIFSPTTGSVWEVTVQPGDQVLPGDQLVVIESMKMEIPVEAEGAGKVAAILCEKGEAVSEGQPLVEVE